MSTANPENLLKNIGKHKGPAPVHLWDPPYCGEIDIRIAADGLWYHEGSPIGRLPMVQLFSSILRLDDDGHYYLVTPAERVRIKVDDCPFVAQQLEVEGSGKAQKLLFTLNTQEQVTAGRDNRIAVTVDSGGQPHPVIHVRHGLNALISRSVFYRLVDLAQVEPPPDKNAGNGKNSEKTNSLVLFSAGEKFSLGDF
ncbi:MAG: DUF1285 domain-containing protein [Pseudohongiella sp.]|nr:DUF1285 domain-containing protein [Pseudohongiella sp.]